MNRIAFIAESLKQHAANLNVEDDRLSPDEWNALEFEEGNSRPLLGFTCPTKIEGTWKLRYCVERIAETTAMLTEDDLDKYVFAVCWIISKEVVLSDLSADERILRADAALAEVAFDSLRLVTEVQFAALDKESV